MADRPERAGRPERRRVGLLLAGLLFVMIGGYPVTELFTTAVGRGMVAAARDLTGAGSAAVNTLWTSAAATLLALVGGLSAAWITERSEAPWPMGLRGGVVLSLLVPPFVSALSWMRAYGPGGLTHDVWGSTLPGLLGPVGVVVVLAVHGMPLAYVMIAAALGARAEPDLERAARAAGATAAEAFRTITVPLLRPALVGASVIVFVTSANAFGIPALLGTPAGFVTMTTRIYQDLVLAADPAAFTRAVVLAAGLALLSLALVAAVEVLGGLSEQVVRTTAPVGAPVPPLRKGWLPAACLWIYLLLTTGVPLTALVLTALTRAAGLPPVLTNWTLANFAEALSGQGVLALRNSTILAITAATAVVGLGGLLTALRQRRSGRAVGILAVLTFAIPGSALAVAVLLAYGALLRDTLLLILVAYLAKFWALGHRPIAGAADGLPPDLTSAARASGATSVVALRTVVVPLLRPAIAGAWMLVALFAFHELTMSILLYGPGTETLAVAVLNVQQLGDVTVTSALAVLLTGIVLCGAVALWLLRRGAALAVSR